MPTAMTLSGWFSRFHSRSVGALSYPTTRLAHGSLSCPPTRLAPGSSHSALIDGHMLTNEEEVELVEGLQVAEDDQWLKLLYRCKCKKVRVLSHGGLSTLFFRSRPGKMKVENPPDLSSSLLAHRRPGSTWNKNRSWQCSKSWSAHERRAVCSSSNRNTRVAGRTAWSPL